MFLKLNIFLVLACFSLLSQAEEFSKDERRISSEEIWNAKIRPAFFQERDILENSAFELKAPERVEDAAVVPVTIKFDASTDLSVKNIYVFIDKNPSPLAGTFSFPGNAEKADLALRVRVDDFSYIRAVVETNEGKLYMSRSFVKAGGGCSAPANAGNIALLGKIKTRLMGKLKLEQPNLIQLMIKHPNFSGLETAMPGQKKPEPHFIRKLDVSFEDE